MPAVHPRVCGELQGGSPQHSIIVGSSPRVWGTRNSAAVRHSGRRFIPACVGNSDCLVCRWQWVPVHPRVCGELIRLPLCGCPHFRSSPRVWGTLMNETSVLSTHRFIPACVGNSDPIPVCARIFPVHPRVCGELPSVRPRLIRYQGSSPRVWGTHPGPPPLGIGSRFIPACVGNSPWPSSSGDRVSVHPRVCGELVAKPMLVVTLPRFIPACVGNSYSTRQSGATVPVHPRVCGELPIEAVTSDTKFGSSPRVWGTLVRH